IRERTTCFPAILSRPFALRLGLGRTRGEGAMNRGSESPSRWYAAVTRYQWLVLVIASLGWIFDVFERQIFVSSQKEATPALLPAGTPEAEANFYANIAYAAFLVGGALGGIVFWVIELVVAGRWPTRS